MPSLFRVVADQLPAQAVDVNKIGTTRNNVAGMAIGLAGLPPAIAIAVPRFIDLIRSPLEVLGYQRCTRASPI